MKTNCLLGRLGAHLVGIDEHRRTIAQHGFASDIDVDGTDRRGEGNVPWLDRRVGPLWRPTIRPSCCCELVNWRFRFGPRRLRPP